MIYGYSKTLGKISVTNDTRYELAFCPVCACELISKMGPTITDHWAHKTTIDCPGSKPESDWHRWWKSSLPKENVECIVEKNGVIKVADIKFNNGKVVELQNSPISTEAIILREEHYQDMFWIFNGIEAFDKGRFSMKKITSYNGAFHYKFRWKHPKKTLSFGDKKKFIDLGDEVFRIDSMNINAPCIGNGHTTKKTNFINYIERNTI